MSADIATALFRVFQETLTNVARHAHATQVEVDLTQAAGQLWLQITDNGIGISDQEARATKSLGLLGMRERVRLLSGNLEITGRPGKGTAVLVKIPFDHPPTPEAPAKHAPR